MSVWADFGSNIDRLLAIYQTLYPHNWFLGSDKPPSNASLKPFYHAFPGDHTSETRLFTSDDVRDWTKFGYQYDLLQRQPGESQDEYIARINTWVKSNYNGTAAVLLKDPKGLFNGAFEDQSYPDYIIDVIYDRYDVPSHQKTRIMLTDAVMLSVETHIRFSSTRVRFPSRKSQQEQPL